MSVISQAKKEVGRFKIEIAKPVSSIFVPLK